MEILDKYNIIPNDISIYNKALTHPSYSNENGLEYNYERLEFLGDKILDFIISEYLYLNKDINEGDMTKLRASYVCEKALYKYATNIELNNHILLGHGEEASGGRKRPAIIADVFEAFLAAIYIDKGIEEAKKFIYDSVIPYIESDSSFFQDYKSKLQELIQPFQKILTYEIVEEIGPAHNKTFTIAAKIDGKVFGIGVAGSKKEAEQRAAKDALNKQV